MTALLGWLRVLYRGAGAWAMCPHGAQPPRPGAPVSGVGILLQPPASWGPRGRARAAPRSPEPSQERAGSGSRGLPGCPPGSGLFLGAEESEPTPSLVHRPVAADSKIFSQRNCLPKSNVTSARRPFLTSQMKFSVRTGPGWSIRSVFILGTHGRGASAGLLPHQTVISMSAERKHVHEPSHGASRLL